MELGEFQLESIKLKTECVREYTTGHFSCLEGEFLLTRALGYYILQNRVLQFVEHDYIALYICTCTIHSFEFVHQSDAI